MSEQRVEPVATEGALLEPLVEWLRRRRWVREDTLLAPEFAWCGRYVDIAAMTRSGIATAFELKLRDNSRALEQAAANTLSFDRSYVVTATPPRNGLLGQAYEVGVGVILVSDGRVTLLQDARLAPRSAILRPRLVARMREVGSCLKPSLTM